MTEKQTFLSFLKKQRKTQIVQLDQLIKYKFNRKRSTIVVYCSQLEKLKTLKSMQLLLKLLLLLLLSHLKNILRETVFSVQE